MLSAIRSRITYVNVVATLVLVFVMTGGAYAAKKYLITSTKQISPSVLKSLQGKAGPAGANGAQGAAGPAGPQGAAGAGGAGPQGPAGVGTPGKEGAKGATGKEGPEGLKGLKGPEGAPGPTCPSGECLLPAGATETGVWSFVAKDVSGTYVSISFPLKLSQLSQFPEPANFHYVTVTEQNPTEPSHAGAVAEGCTGNFEEPKAEPKLGEPTLCLYESENHPLQNVETVEERGKTLSGTVVEFNLEVPANEANGTGTWAVAQ